MVPGDKNKNFHIHWLEAFGWGRLAKRNALVRAFLAKRILQHAEKVNLSGGKVVWTAHNIKPHDQFRDDPVFLDFSEKIMEQITDIVSMSSTAKSLLLENYPKLSTKRHHVIPHPHYSEYFGDILPNITPDKKSHSGKLIVVFGIIRPYKQVPEIVKAFQGLSDQDRLVVLGDCKPPEMKRMIDAIDEDARITFHRRKYDDSEIYNLLKAADLAVFNFRDILNSGSVLTALSLNCPALAPDLDVLRELQDEVGPEWLHLFHGPIKTKDISRAFSVHRSAERPTFTASEPKDVACAHWELYSLQ